MGYRDMGPGWCNRCQRPVYHPQFVRPGFEGCQCEAPDLETWEQWDAKLAEPPAPAPVHVKPGTILRVTARGMWKRRAKYL